MECKRTIHVADLEFAFTCEFEERASVDIDLEVESLADSPDSYLVHAAVRELSSQPFVLRGFSITWTVPLVDMHGLYFGGNPHEELAYLPFWKTSKQVCSNTGLPYIALIHRNGENRAAFGLLDQLTETGLSAELSETTRSYHVEIRKPLQKGNGAAGLLVQGPWEERLFVSRARQPWPDVLRQYAGLTDRLAAHTKMPVPGHAYDPVFCTWTAIHHDVSHDWIMRNAPLAAQLGFKTWITDDGWFIPEGRFADYSRTGDWEPCQTKFPDFAAHVKGVQDLGFHYVLWVSPFMVGEKSQAAKRLAPLLTTGQERLHFNNLAPWRHETQVIIGDLLERLVRDYDLDGLKIDFIDSISVHDGHQDGAARATIGESIFTTLKAATDRLLALKPDLLIEFRNSYANLASRSYANIYRSSDVPINFALNRWQAVMLRLLAPDRAVHLDPALWHPNDSDENVAVHLINCLVSVPMVSIELDKYPQSHLDLIRYWIGFYNEHRDTIIHGEFKPTLALGHVPLIVFKGVTETIIGLYDDVPVALDPQWTNVWLLNASTRPYIELGVSEPRGDCEIIVRNKFGQIVSKQAVGLPTARLSVEVGGSVELTGC